MHSPRETVLAVVPGNLDDERLLVVHRHGGDGVSRIELRQQTFGEGVGWFTQSSVPIAPEQLAQLRVALGATSRAAACSRNCRPEMSADRPQLRIAHAESA